VKARPAIGRLVTESVAMVKERSADVDCTTGASAVTSTTSVVIAEIISTTDARMGCPDALPTAAWKNVLDEKCLWILARIRTVHNAERRTGGHTSKGFLVPGSGFGSGFRVRFRALISVQGAAFGRSVGVLSCRLGGLQRPSTESGPEPRRRGPALSDNATWRGGASRV
jgi:hypothetical protein